MKPDLRRALSCTVAACAIMLAQAASAEGFTIVAGPPVTTTQILDTEGNVGTVEAGGVIAVTDGHGIEATANGVTVDNAGDVTGTGAFFSGIHAGDNNTITNSGTATGGFHGILADDDNTITNSGVVTGGLYGIYAEGDNTITNSGAATGTGAGSFGIYADGENTITNSGTATGEDSGISAWDENTIINSGAIAGGSAGIRANDDNTITNSGAVTGGTYAAIRANDGNTISNSGTAIGTGIASYGIYADNENTITNSGTAKGGDHGIYVINNNTIINSGTATGLRRYGIHGHNSNIITNSGVAKGSGVNSAGIDVTNSNIIVNSGVATGDYGIWAGGSNTITSSGTIAGQTAAVRLDGVGNTLKLLAGSNIQGNLDLGDGNTLSIGAGLNTALAFTGTPIIETGGLPTLVDGGVVYVIDPTGFSAAGEMVADLTGIVAGALDQRLAATRGGPAGAGVYGMTATHGMFGAAVGDGADNPGAAAWVTALGGYRDRGADGLNAGFDNLVGGLMAGADTAIDANWRGGLFIGAAAARMRTDPRSQTIDSGNYFAGGYASFTGASAFLDLSLTAGVSDFSSDRSVANNMVAGGVEHAEADYRGFFVSPSVTLGRDFARDDGGVFTPSLRARYAGLFLDGYEESGSAADLSVGSRSVSVFELRAQLAYGFAPRQQENATLDTTLRVGADGVFSDGGSIDASLLGNPLDFSAVGYTDEAVRGFVGFDAAYAMAGGASFTVGTELGYDSNDAFTARAAAGLQIPL